VNKHNDQKTILKARAVKTVREAFTRLVHTEAPSEEQLLSLATILAINTDARRAWDIIQGNASLLISAADAEISSERVLL